MFKNKGMQTKIKQGLKDGMMNLVLVEASKKHPNSLHFVGRESPRLHHRNVDDNGVFMQFWRPCTGRCTGVHGRAHLRKVKVLLSADQKVHFLCSGTGPHGRARAGTGCCFLLWIIYWLVLADFQMCTGRCTGWHGRALACTGRCTGWHGRALLAECWFLLPKRHLFMFSLLGGRPDLQIHKQLK